MKLKPLSFALERLTPVPEPTSSFRNKTILITGSNTGLGLEAAIKFARLDTSRLILAVRDPTKGAAAKAQIEARSGRQDGLVVEVWPLDMGDYESIQAFAARAEKELERVDVAVLNAGVSPYRYVESSEGWESTLQVNVLGTALLGLLLLPKMRASSALLAKASASPPSKAHLVVVTSVAHDWLEWSDLPDPTPSGGNMLRAASAKPAEGKPYGSQTQYSISKLFAMYATQALAKAATGADGNAEVIVTSVCPGACRSDLMRNSLKAGLGVKVAVDAFQAVFSKSAEAGAKSYVIAAALGEEAHGGFVRTTQLSK